MRRVRGPARFGRLDGGIVAFDDTVDLARQARFAMEFCATESCGKCTSAASGRRRGVDVLDRIIANQERTANLRLLDDLCELMLDGSLCALGGLTPFPVQSAIRHFPEDFAETRASLGAPPIDEQFPDKQGTGDYGMALIQETDHGTPARRGHQALH